MQTNLQTCLTLPCRISCRQAWQAGDRQALNFLTFNSQRPQGWNNATASLGGGPGDGEDDEEIDLSPLALPEYKDNPHSYNKDFGEFLMAFMFDFDVFMGNNVQRNKNPIITGTPPDIIGGPLQKGQKAIKLGRYLLNPKAWHVVKKPFLRRIGYSKFAYKVGKNPDIGIKGSKIVLSGQGPFKGKTYETGYDVVSFIKEFF